MSERADRVVAVTQAVQEWVAKDRYATHEDVLAVIEAVREPEDAEWYYVVVVRRHHEEWDLLTVYEDAGSWEVHHETNALSWNQAVVEAMAYATRLYR
jgi:hypothetical protein